jgi:hypothetical protein
MCGEFISLWKEDNENPVELAQYLGYRWRLISVMCLEADIQGVIDELDTLGEGKHDLF